MSNKKNLLIFDCDGTLIESEYANNAVISNAIQDLGYKEYTVKKCIKKFRGKGLIDIVKRLSLETGDQIDQQQLLDSIRNSSFSAEEYIKAVDNVHAVLERLSLKKCVASNGDRGCVTKYLKQTDIYDFFGGQNIFTGDQVGNPKPAPDLFMYAAEMLKSHHKDVVVVEDSKVGIIAAKKAKMKAIGFVGTSIDKEGSARVLKSVGADYVISDLEDLFAIMKDLDIKIEF